MEGRAEEVEPRWERKPLDLELFADLMEAASDFSGVVPFSPAKPADDDRGLSVLAEPGILLRIDSLSDLEDSFVSERPKAGRLSKAEASLLVSPLLGLDG